MNPATSFIFDIWDHIASYLSRDDLTRLAILSDFHLQVARWHLYKHVVLRNERQAVPAALDTVYLILRNPLLQRRIESFTILTPSMGMSGPTEHKNWVERFGLQVFGALSELRKLHLKRPPYARVRLLERFLNVVSKSCRKITHLTIEGPTSAQYRSVGSKYTFATPLYQVPSLRSLVVNGRNSNLGWNIASGVLLHPISNVTSLHIEISLPEQRWLADPSDFSDIWSLRFPYLTHLTVGDIPQGAHSATLSIFLNRHPTITHLALTARDADRTFSITPEPDALPALRHLSVSPHMLHWLQVNVTLLSLRSISSLVLDCSSIAAGGGAGAELSTSQSVFYHFPYYPQFSHLKHFTLLGLWNVSITRSLMLTFAQLAPRLEHWTGGFYHRHNLGDMLELSSALSSHPHLRRLDICQWIGAGCGIDEGSIGPFGAIFAGLMDPQRESGMMNAQRGSALINPRRDSGLTQSESGRGLEKVTIFATHVHAKVYEVVQAFKVRDRPGVGGDLEASGGGSGSVTQGNGNRGSGMMGGLDALKRSSSQSSRELVETYCMNSTKYGYQVRRVLDFASTEWEYDEAMEVY